MQNPVREPEEQGRNEGRGIRALTPEESRTKGGDEALELCIYLYPMLTYSCEHSRDRRRAVGRASEGCKGTGPAKSPLQTSVGVSRPAVAGPESPVRFDE